MLKARGETNMLKARGGKYFTHFGSQEIRNSEPKTTKVFINN